MSKFVDIQTKTVSDDHLRVIPFKTDARSEIKQAIVIETQPIIMSNINKCYKQKFFCLLVCISSILLPI